MRQTPHLWPQDLQDPQEYQDPHLIHFFLGILTGPLAPEIQESLLRRISTMSPIIHPPPPLFRKSSVPHPHP